MKVVILSLETLKYETGIIISYCFQILTVLYLKDCAEYFLLPPYHLNPTTLLGIIYVHFADEETIAEKVTTMKSSRNKA